MPRSTVTRSESLKIEAGCTCAGSAVSRASNSSLLGALPPLSPGASTCEDIGGLQRSLAGTRPGRPAGRLALLVDARAREVQLRESATGQARIAIATAHSHTATHLDGAPSEDGRVLPCASAANWLEGDGQVLQQAAPGTERHTLNT